MPNNRIKKVLIANRTEIALRIQRACDKLELPCVITVSDVDKQAFFAKSAHEVAHIGGNSAEAVRAMGLSALEHLKKAFT